MISEHPTLDYRKVLNTMLSIYYEKKGAFSVTHEISCDNGIHLKLNDIMACIHTLTKDGYIEDIAPGYSRIPVCTITASGRIFYEQGGYQDETTRFDRTVKWAKNHKFLAWVLIAFIVVSSLIGLAVSIVAVYGFYQQ